jgi:hypothetical protein
MALNCSDEECGNSRMSRELHAVGDDRRLYSSAGIAREQTVPGSGGGGRAKAVRDGREFLEYKYCFRCVFTGTFTDCMDNGIVSTMADSSTAVIAKQTFSNGV